MSVAPAIRLPESLQREASRLAERDGMSLEEWVSVTVAQRLGAIETAAEFFARRGHGTATLEQALAVLNSAPDNPPDPGDELPEGYAESR